MSIKKLSIKKIKTIKGGALACTTTAKSVNVNGKMTCIAGNGEGALGAKGLQ